VSYIVDSSDVDNANYQLATSLTLPAQLLDFSMVVWLHVNSAGVESSDARLPSARSSSTATATRRRSLRRDVCHEGQRSRSDLHRVNQTLNLLPSMRSAVPRYIITPALRLTVNPRWRHCRGLAPGP